MVKDRLVGLLFRFVVGVGVVVEPPADFDSLRGNPSVACGHPFGNVPYGQPPLSGEAGLRAAYGGWPWGLLRSPLGGRFTVGFVPKNRALPYYQAIRLRFLTAV